MPHSLIKASHLNQPIKNFKILIFSISTLIYSIPKNNLTLCILSILFTYQFWPLTLL